MESRNLSSVLFNQDYVYESSVFKSGSGNRVVKSECGKTISAFADFLMLSKSNSDSF